MKIALITTLPGLSENERIKEETENLGHDFELIDLRDFGFVIEDNKLKVKGVSDIKADIVIVRGVFLAIKTISAIVESLRDRGIKIFDNNFLEHRYSIDKVTDIVKLSLKNVPTPNTYYARDFKHYEKLVKKCGFPCVIKSSRMGKGAGVHKIEDEKDLFSFIEDAEERGKSSKSYLIQEFIPYIYDLRVLLVGKDEFTMRRIPAKGEFRANFSLGGDVEDFGLDKKGKDLALRALSAIDMSVGGVDILITKDDKRYVLEVNHTAGFVGMEKAVGENIGKIFVEHAIANAV